MTQKEELREKASGKRDRPGNLLVYGTVDVQIRPINLHDGLVVDELFNDECR